ncbi:thiamine biosynthesis protein ThiS [Thermus scotoductus]|uniref:Thiamine biosynthesis protein ThiS n=1 Tax=Thermus scotoductus TaxID=37636 RepID=A0A430SBD9_THESC|nr:sulfur carrier protein ThiS [Thermus scotoductus]RTG95834.1 thiamine biosynthesis protein ThiS [Thermus scotoductus]RTH11414.1 thiamine biosynthesis protein ThiS [Thermus scotoductus]RTH11779.1 thiamine biosynthesis protein ThiS [Thermus scotoductus]RTH12983.1 thiamine biosynthesis protein ThiS [Thermus scotoductus]RTH18193.1 thiamine biosynthesis protein ThiS [Thermus scotoductus]
MVWLNGEPKPLEGRTLKEVLEELGVALERVAVLLNEEAFPGAEVPERVLKEGDMVEVVALMQGG